MDSEPEVTESKELKEPKEPSEPSDPNEPVEKPTVRKRSGKVKKKKSKPKTNKKSSKKNVQDDVEHISLTVIPSKNEEAAHKQIRVEAKVSLDKTYSKDLEAIQRDTPHEDALEKEPRLFFGVDPFREHWANRVTYLLVLMLSVITLRNVFRFPVLAFRHGFSFVIAYVLLMFLIGYPTHLFMVALGVYAQRSLVRAWDGAPIARGVAWSMFGFCFFGLWYYGYYGAYGLLYFGHCLKGFDKMFPWKADLSTFGYFRPEAPELTQYCNRLCEPRQTPDKNPPLDSSIPLGSYFYFYQHILGFDNFQDMWIPGGSSKLNIKLVIAFIILWLALSLIVIKGITSVGKLVFVLLGSIYFIGIMLLIVTFLLRGCSYGFVKMLAFEPDNLGTATVWRDAAEQVLLELGVVFGVPLLYGSYCNFQNNIPFDSLFICLVSMIHSILSVLMFFGALGNVSYYSDLRWDDFQFFGPAIVYIIYSDAFVNIGGAVFWCMCFGLLIFLTCIAAMIGPLLVISSIIYETFPDKKKLHWIFYLVLCVLLVLSGLLIGFAKTFYIVHLMDWLPGTSPVIFIVMFFIAFLLLYGINKLSEDIHFSNDWYPWAALKYYFCIIPLILFIIYIAGIVSDSYTLIYYSKEYSSASIVAGWIIFALIILPIPVFVIVWIVKCLARKKPEHILASKVTWGPRHILGRYARARFSSEA